tara:strand:- start:253 stop:438 length:186 start_codon:yes stop_codon:yes gene_type:complete
MVVSERAFAKAWILIKEQPADSDFTPEESKFIMDTLLKMINSKDLRMQEEAGMLYSRFSRI